MTKYIKIKEELINLLILDLEKQLKIYDNEMKKAQEEANHHKGAMQSRYDTFKEEAQILKEGFSKQYNNISNMLSSLLKYKNNINISKDIVKIGSLVLVSENNKNKYYYILPNILYSILELNKTYFECINSNTPLAKSLIGKEIDDEIIFNNKIIEIANIV